jgi:two-component system sensor histidine kinase BaeS
MKIQNKLFMILFGFSLLLVTMLVLLMQWSLGKGMIDYVNTKEIEALNPVVEKLAEEYRKENSWLSMAGQHRKFHNLILAQLRDSDFSEGRIMPPPEQRPFRNPSPKNRLKKSPKKLPQNHAKPPPRIPLEHDARYALQNSDETIIVGKLLKDLNYSQTSIIVDNNIVGFFAVSKRNRLTQGYEVDFIEQQQNYLWLIALLSIILVALVTFPLARHVVEPIKLITRGMHKLTQGNYQQPIHLNRQDELSELSRDYNELALTLAENETARKRWLANISHELRTPVAILRGELEAMLDDVRPMTKENISSSNDEVKHLQRLIDDLSLLTSTDVGGMRYQKQHEELTALMEAEVDKYRSYLADAGIKLSLDIAHQNLDIYCDKTRLCQLFENVINNSIKYSSATEFKISLSIDNASASDKSTALMTFEDNGVGVESVHLDNLFEHLYRVDDSRNRTMGGSGLGLAICRHIVIAHQGEISAEQATLGGLAIIIKLPIS